MSIVHYSEKFVWMEVMPKHSGQKNQLEVVKLFLSAP